MLRMRGLLAASGQTEPPEIWIASSDPNLERSGGFVSLIPSLKFGGYFDIRSKVFARDVLKVFSRGEVRKNWQGFDLFICVNKMIEDGWPIEKIMPEAGAPDWDYAINAPDQLENFDLIPTEPFIEVSFFNHGMYTKWWNKYNPELYIKDILARTTYRMVLTGGKWDFRSNAELEKIDPERIRNISGMTPVPTWFELKRRSAGFIGHISGSSIMSQHFRRPTAVLWCPEPIWTPGMRTCWVRPDMRTGGYQAMSVEVRPEVATAALLKAIHDRDSR